MMSNGKRRYLAGLLAVGIIAIILIGFGGACAKKNSSKDTVVSSSAAPSVAIVGEAVDPYIEGARFFEDIDNDGVKDAGEQVSSLSNSLGVFTFQDALQEGSTITLDGSVTPTHVGVDYTAKIKRKVGAGETTGSLVASPLTTLLANGWTELQIVGVLTQAGLSSITTTDLTLNPMSVIENYDSAVLTTSHLTKIKSSIAIYCFLSIMDGIITATDVYDLTYDAFVSCTYTNTAALLTRMVDQISFGLSPTILSTIQGQMNAISLPPLVPPLPVVTAGDVIRASVAIANYIIPKVIVDINYAPTLNQCVTWAQQLGYGFYIIRNNTNQTIIAGSQFGSTPPIDPDLLTYNTFIINPTSGLVEGQ